MGKSYRKFYILSLIGLLICSIYPLFMGFKTIFLYFSSGYIYSSDYGKYVIPYTPICIALIFVFAIYPVIGRYLRRSALLVATVMALGLFFITEIGFEQIDVVTEGHIVAIESSEGGTVDPETVASWQLSLCIATPEVLESLGEPLYAQNKANYKVHFYLISVILIITVVYLLHGYTQVFRDGNVFRKRPLIAQLGCTVVFIGLCILANFTSFFRNGTINIDPLSAVLTSSFFIVFGASFGIYLGCIFYGKNKWMANIIPSIFAILLCIGMYIGEATLQGGELYRFGSWFLFQPIGSMMVAPIDLLIIALSGLITYLLLVFVNAHQMVDNF